MGEKQGGGRLRRLPDVVPPGAKFNLTDCHRLLVKALNGSAPSAITLRRHAGAGRLKECIAPGGTRGRPLYYWEKVKALYPPPPDAPEAGSQPQTAGQGGYTDEQLQRVLGSLLAPVLTQLAEVTKQVASLPAVRNSLMAKYDAAAAAALNRAEEAGQDVKEMRKLLDLDTNLMKLTASVNKIVEAMSKRD